MQNGFYLYRVLGRAIGINASKAAIKRVATNSVTKTSEQSVLYEVGEGVRRANASDMLGKKTITATNSQAEIFEVPIENHRSPMKSEIDISTASEKLRFEDIFNGIKNEGQQKPIYVAPGSRGIKIKDITFKK